MAGCATAGLRDRQCPRGDRVRGTGATACLRIPWRSTGHERASAGGGNVIETATPSELVAQLEAQLDEAVRLASNRSETVRLQRIQMTAARLRALTPTVAAVSTVPSVDPYDLAQTA
jgi:hypothetical protein